MKITNTGLSLVILVICNSTINVAASCMYHTFMVGLDSSSLTCPAATENCHNVTINSFSVRHDSLYTNCGNKFVFQSGIHHLKGKLPLRGGHQLTLEGKGNAIIMCPPFYAVNILLTTDLNITIKDLTFFNNCMVIEVSSRIVEFANTFLIKSCLTLKKAPRGKSLLVQGSSNNNIIAITCKDATVNISVTSKTIVNVSNIQFLNCSNVNLISRSKLASAQIYKALFSNSCLQLVASRTRSFSQHNVSITVNKTKFEHCVCHSMTIASESSIHFYVSLTDVSVTKNHSPFLEVENRKVSIVVTGNCVFHQNRNLVLSLEDVTVSFIRANVSFIGGIVTGNAVQGAPIYAKQSRISFEESTVLFRQNQGPLCGGIVAESTQIYFNENVTITFCNNSGLNGGALSLYTESRLHFNAAKSTTTLYFENNIAQIGGAIYVEDSGYSNIESVFKLECEPENVKLVFSKNNIASFSGNQIYGGWIDWFVNETNKISENRADLVSMFIEFSNRNHSQVSSHPIRICLREKGIVNCKITNHNMTIYGKALSLDIVGVGQRYTPVISHVLASLSPEGKSKICPIASNNYCDILVSLQSACTKIDYKISSQNNEEEIMLKPYLPYLYYSSHSRGVITNHTDDSLFQQLIINLKINKCPWGFGKQINGSCECQVLKHGLQCDMSDYTILRSGQQWVGTTCEHCNDEKIPGVITHQHCPFDYCRSDRESLSIRLENQDKQCAFNREGILCGGCKGNLSRVLGTSNCLECTSKYTVLIAVSWLISGFILIICLMLLNLTVSVGTINGLTFYANIIRTQHTTFFTPDISDSFLSKFIAWLNLDIGTEMCLYDGLDSYAITWLQYFYPLYIWLIAAIIIILSHYSSRISKLCGKNAVQVLATLFLVSYARLLRLMIEVFSFTWIIYPDGYKKAVWLVDGNYEFFKGKLIPLVLVTVLFVLLTLPYTFTLLTIQFLQKISHYRIFFWVRRLKPFFDAYTGPYKSRHRYWTGLLLVARLVLLITFSVNQSNNASINLLAIVTVSVVLLGWLSSANWVYISLLNNFLEIIFLGNLGLTSAAVLFSVSNGKSSPATIYLSTSVAFALLTFITFYHIYRQLVLTKLSSKLTVKLMQVIPFKSVSSTNDMDDTVELSDAIPTTSRASGHGEVTSTIVDLNQPCSQSVYTSYNSYELKEPLLDDET